MLFRHSTEVWAEFPELVPGVLCADGISALGSVETLVARYTEVAAARLARSPEGALPEIQAWRGAFSRMGLKPTQYRCASEALLRRFKKEGRLPRLHPLVDLCNAISMAYAIPIAVFDRARIGDRLEVRHATGTETYLAFSGETEHPEPREVVFSDSDGEAHARRWTNRQSAASAVRDDTTAVLIVAEAMHGSATADIGKLTAAVAEGLASVWSVAPETVILTRSSPWFET